jgi:hypothetical protein
MQLMKRSIVFAGLRRDRGTLKVLQRCAVCASAFFLYLISANAGVLPEDRAEVVGHIYQGGGVKVYGPTVLVRKKIGENIDLSVAGDEDFVSSASIDVVTAASPYKEVRKQWSPSVSYLHGKTTYSLSYLKSQEPDYLSNNGSFTISEDMFGDLTTVTLGFSRGWDHVRQHLVDKAKHTSTYTDVFTENDEVVSPRLDRRDYRVGLSQILTKKLIMSANYESAAQEGFLRNPYRRIRYGDANSASVSYQSEIYPHTRTSNAVGLEARYYLDYRASIKLGYRYYTDTWGINSHTGDLEYVHPFGSRWLTEWSVRYYSQNGADFYSDLFPYQDAQNFMARDRELATFNDISFHVGVTWKIPVSNKLSFATSLMYDRIQYNYKDFRDNRDVLVDGKLTALPPNQQPLYKYGANVFMLQGSLNY